MRTTIQAVFALLLIASISEARTWRVNTTGTGDAPNLYAAMDSAAAWDSVLVEAGQYELSMGRLDVPANVRLVGEAGPSMTVLTQTSYVYNSAVYLQGASMSGIHLRASASPVARFDGGEARFCVFEGSIFTALVEGPLFLHFENCLFANGVVSAAGSYVQCIITGGMTSSAGGSMVYSSDVLGDVDPSIDVSGANLNFSLDPQFCGLPGSGNYFLMSTSPCLPENSPFGPAPYVVGPLPMGCGTVRVESKTWGGIKALYR